MISVRVGGGEGEIFLEQLFQELGKKLKKKVTKYKKSRKAREKFPHSCYPILIPNSTFRIFFTLFLLGSLRFQKSF